ncbi:hypothetical protein CEE37_03610 [candidate division LCP-89 bacterium B3_LCP]|uniref:Secretion system C-terminal sorting domain-containing protein n=1 Tax=candidate division LCP-89 bacterium B3_LCP TaxID=2012998 RepID=A0A532V3A5_UNCL8|nr:MAG: hypothetical protein CEE37_03610 [candidate division LCP-89 bacterium B3_LCP]
MSKKILFLLGVSLSLAVIPNICHAFQVDGICKLQHQDSDWSGTQLYVNNQMVGDPTQNNGHYEFWVNESGTYVISLWNYPHYDVKHMAVYIDSDKTLETVELQAKEYTLEGICTLQNQPLGNYAGTFIIPLVTQPGLSFDPQWKETNRNGGYALKLVAGNYHIDFTHSGYSSDYMDIIVDGSGGLDSFELQELLSSYYVVGRCYLDDQANHSGTTVSASGEYTQITGNQGKYEFSLPAGNYTFSYTHTGYLPGQLGPVGIADSTILNDVTLNRLHGVVYGNCYLSDTTWHAETTVTILGGSGSFSGSTDGDGGFQIFDVPYDNYDATYYHDGYWDEYQYSILVFSDVTSLDDEWLYPISPSVYVVDGECYLTDTTWHAGTTVTLSGNSGTFNDVTSGGGYFLIEGVPGGSYNANFHHDGYWDDNQYVEVNTNETMYSWLSPLAVPYYDVDGYCYLQDTTDHGGTGVILWGASDYWSASTGSGGYYSMSGIPSGSYDVDFYHSGYYPEFSNISVTGNTTLSSVTLGCPGGEPLPVVLTDFCASVEPEYVLLIWNTAGEIECYGWVVQRSLNKAEGWGSIPIWEDISPVIPGSGTTIEPHDYSFTDCSTNNHETYNYRLKQIDIGGSATYSDYITVTISGMDVTEYHLYQNYPNPFNPVTTISYSLPEAVKVSLIVYDVGGRSVTEIVSGWRDEGVHEAVFDGSGLASGVYLYRLTAGEFTDTGKMVLMK